MFSTIPSMIMKGRCHMGGEMGDHVQHPKGFWTINSWHAMAPLSLDFCGLSPTSLLVTILSHHSSSTERFNPIPQLETGLLSCTPTLARLRSCGPWRIHTPRFSVVWGSSWYVAHAARTDYSVAWYEYFVWAYVLVARQEARRQLTWALERSLSTPKRLMGIRLCCLLWDAWSARAWEWRLLVVHSCGLEGSRCWRGRDW